MNNRLSELATMVAGLNDDGLKFYEKSNKSAGTRLRKGLQEVKKLAQEIRLEISEQKKAS